MDRRDSESPEARHLRLDVDPALREAVLALAPDARVALVVAARGASGAEIAAAIVRSDAATRTLLTRARQRVRAPRGGCPMTSFAPATSPITHDRALDIAAAAPAFRPAEDDATELAAHLAACSDCARRVARMRTDLAAIGHVGPPVSPRLHDRIREAAVAAPRAGPSLAGIVLLFALAAVAFVGASIGVGAHLGTARPAPAPAGPVLPVRDTDAIR